MRSLCRWIFSAVIIGAFAASAGAHDPYQGWASARLSPGGMEIEITLAMATARLTLGDAGGKKAMNPDNFLDFLPLLQARAKEMYLVTAGGEKVDPTDVKVVLTEEYDVNYRIDYPAPAAAPLAFRATYLESLENGYGSTFVILDSKNRQLAYKDLFVDDSIATLDRLPTAAEEAAPVARIYAAPSSAPQSVAIASAAEFASTPIPTPAPLNESAAAPAPTAAPAPVAAPEAKLSIAVYAAAGALLLALLAIAALKRGK